MEELYIIAFDFFRNYISSVLSKSLLLNGKCCFRILHLGIFFIDFIKMYYLLHLDMPSMSVPEKIHKGEVFMSKIKEILEYAMRMENDAQEFYSFYMDRVKAPEHKLLFEELAEMEKTHYAVLSSVYDQLGVIPPPIEMSWVVDDTSRERNVSIIPDNSELISDESALSDLSIIRLAYLMESDFAFFYSNAANQVEDKEAKKLLFELADWEKKHEVMFKVRYEKLLKQSWKDVAGIIFK